MINISWDVFLLPGDYQATVALYYTGHTAHSLTSERIHVAPLKHDLLPALWQDLPAVEFSDPQPEGLDTFLLPNIAGRLRLPLQPHRQIHLQIMENVTPYPSERRHPMLYADRLSLFLPILKTFTQLQVENGTLGVSLFDFTRHSVIFEQQAITKGQVAWSDLENAMTASSVATVNAHDLEQGEQFGQFFWSEIARRLEQAPSDAALPVLIVISGPMDLGTKKPIEIAPPPAGNFAVFYIRCDFLQTPTIIRSRYFPGEVRQTQQSLERFQDGIGKALRPLKPRVFAVSSAQNARDALASILSALSKM
jgi:hypothetical protein